MVSKNVYVPEWNTKDSFLFSYTMLSFPGTKSGSAVQVAGKVPAGIACRFGPTKKPVFSYLKTSLSVISFTEW